MVPGKNAEQPHNTYAVTNVGTKIFLQILGTRWSRQEKINCEVA